MLVAVEARPWLYSLRGRGGGSPLKAAGSLLLNSCCRAAPFVELALYSANVGLSGGVISV